MDISIIETSGLGDRSYLVDHGDTAVVIDPQRDIDRVLSLAEDRRPARDGDIIDAGPIQLQVMHTPGHTHHHVSYVLRDTDGNVHGVFTGGSMLHGTTGRTDLLGAEHPEALTHAQYHSCDGSRMSCLPAIISIFPAKAEHAQEALLPAMDAVRAAADTLESVVADDLWPLLSYREMLYIL